jgi:hypothetical protein
MLHYITLHHITPIYIYRNGAIIITAQLQNSSAWLCGLMLGIQLIQTALQVCNQQTLQQDCVNPHSSRSAQQETLGGVASLMSALDWVAVWPPAEP